jgi:hypothetical protein
MTAPLDTARRAWLDRALSAGAVSAVVGKFLELIGVVDV